MHPSAVTAPWRVVITSCDVKGLALHFGLEVCRRDGQLAFRVSRTLEEFQRAHDEVKASHKDLQDFPDPRFLWALPAMSTKPWVLDFCIRLQMWIDEVLESSRMQACPALQALFGLPSSRNLWAAPGTPSLMKLAECCQPLLLEIAGYLLGSAEDLANFTSLTSPLLAQQLSVAGDGLWKAAFAAQWPTFHECLSYQAAQNWKRHYRRTLDGQKEYILEVFDREKKQGFAMAAMSARITYDRDLESFVARYISASEVMPETIPAYEGHRLRFCPVSARPQLQPGMPSERSPCSTIEPQPLCYPYKVLEGHGDLVEGQGVELQWKMQFGSPFGWWYGKLERLQRDPTGKLATATITFGHFPSTSRWYRLQVRFGDSEMQPCAFGGFTGGIRPVSPSERRLWMHFFPRQPVAF